MIECAGWMYKDNREGEHLALNSGRGLQSGELL